MYLQKSEDLMKKLEQFPKIFEEYPQNDKQFIRK